jgi:heat shock protein HtpX
MKRIFLFIVTNLAVLALLSLVISLALSKWAAKRMMGVAVSSGLLRNMSRTQVEAVLGHEITHVANGDMVTLALLQGVLNTFVIFLARIVGGIVDRTILRNDRQDSGIGFFLTTMLAQAARLDSCSYS